MSSQPNTITKNFQEIEIPVRDGTTPIRARRYGTANSVVILTDSETERHDRWAPLIEAANTKNYSLLTYDPQGESLDPAEALHAVLDFVEGDAPGGAEKVVVIGMSRGGSVALQVVSKRPTDYLAGIVAVAAPLSHESGRFFEDSDLRMIIAPKLLIDSEFDDFAEDTRHVYTVAEDPRQITHYPGDAHGLDLLAEQAESLVPQLTEFIEWVLRR